MFARRRFQYLPIMVSVAVCLSFAADAKMDQGCVQRLEQQRDQRLQLCREKFEGEHRQLCETAAAQEHDHKIKICESKGAASR
jgi:hypothetical protein